jgi:FMN reductase
VWPVGVVVADVLGHDMRRLGRSVIPTTGGFVKICVLVGNPKKASRTLTLAQALASAISDGSDTISSIDLAEHTDHVFAWPSDQMAKLNEAVATSDLVIVGSPTYKATYTGLLKCFLDRYPSLGLRDVCAIPLMTGADKGHSMGPEVNLRPLLVELGAIVPTRGFYFETPAMDRMEMIIATWVEDNAIALRQVRYAAESKLAAGGVR